LIHRKGPRDSHSPVKNAPPPELEDCFAVIEHLGSRIPMLQYISHDPLATAMARDCMRLDFIPVGDLRIHPVLKD
jgi:hypothetical protein